jgi:uncharacterized protein (TIGR03382 family)
MKRRSDLAFAAAALALSIAPTTARAYCRTASCETQDGAWQVCTPQMPADCGTPLYWPNRCVGYTMQKDASVQVSLADAEFVFQQAFATWMNADCGGGARPSIELVYQGPVECTTQEYNKEKGNANILMFRDGDWPYGGGGVLALTTVTYSKKTGQIYDADMELNSQNVKSFSIGDDNVEFDLLSIATHEAGHFLGIAHSPEPDATMFTNYQQGTIGLRDLTADDVAAICAAYPPTMPASLECDPEPRHGFSADCAVDQPEPEPPESKGCAVATSGSLSRAASGGEGTSSFAALGLLVGLGALVRRRRSA